ncbi:MAG: Holliday junction branch migration protein RuvA [Saccharofermentanales bacterium]
MFSYLEGKIAYKKTDHFVIDVNGLGFRINCSASMLSRIPSQGERTLVYTYMVLREDLVALYGFPTQEELAMFEMLLTVSGVGPKVAGAMVGTLEPSAFALAVISSDIALLSSVKGLGKKGAERIIVELKDKMKGMTSVNGKSLFTPAHAGTGEAGSKFNEACSAMAVLGYTPSEANQAVSAVFDQNISLENIIKAALKELLR